MIQILAKPNWACTNCGMSSGRRYNVERHIKVMHQGYSQAIRFTEYVVGRCDGTVSIPLDVPKARPLYEKSEKADASNGDQLTIELVKACAEMYCAQQKNILSTYPSSTYHQEASQQQPADSDKRTTAVDKDPIFEAAKKMVDQCKVVNVKDPSLEAAKKKFDQLQSNNVNGTAENSMNSHKAASQYEIELKEIVQKVGYNVILMMGKNATSKKP